MKLSQILSLPFEQQQQAAKDVFALVEPHENWKNPIDAIVEIEDLQALETDTETLQWVVGFFTGDPGHWRPVTNQAGDVTAIRFQAPGYYATCGA